MDGDVLEAVCHCNKVTVMADELLVHLLKNRGGTRTLGLPALVFSWRTASDPREMMWFWVWPANTLIQDPYPHEGAEGGMRVFPTRRRCFVL